MQKPPPDRETVINALLKVNANNFHGYATTKRFEQTAIRLAVELLNTPKTEQELCDALENQSHAIDAAGWSGAASLMRDAARRISWHLQHGVDMPGATIPLPKDQLVKELVRFSKSEKFDVPKYTESVFLQAAKIVQDSIDKPVTETEVSDSVKMSDVPAILQEISSYASRAQIAFLDGHDGAGRDFVFKANMRLQNVAALLRIETAESLING